MQIQLVLNLQSTHHKIENLQLILYMQHAGPYFHLGTLSCFKLEARSERFAIDVIQICTIHVLATFTEQVVPIHKHITFFCTISPCIPLVSAPA